MSEDRTPDEDLKLDTDYRGPALDLLRVEPAKGNAEVDLLERMYTSAGTGTRQDCEDVVRAAISSGIPLIDLSDIYVPTVARMLGDAWCKDETSFAQVTIGVARLRGALRLLGPAWKSDEFAAPDASTVLLVVGKDVHHTLGATILCGQLRRRGLSVRVCIGASADDVGHAVCEADFDAVWVSASIGESLESLRLIVDAARNASERYVPVVVGGTIAADERDVQTLTSADLVSVELDKAISFCGLKSKPLKNLRSMGPLTSMPQQQERRA